MSLIIDMKQSAKGCFDRMGAVVTSSKSKALAVGTGLMLGAQQSMAALDPAVPTAVATTSADITEAGTLIIGLAVVAMGVRWVKATFF
jgi:hypothetical protein